MPPNKPEIEALVSNESSMSDYCRFVQNVGVERVDDSPSNGP